MNWKQYQNEFIVLMAFIFMLGAYMYKHDKVNSQTEQATKVQQSIDELKEVVALKKIWADKKLNKKISALQTIVSSSKVKWMKKKQKITASYKGLNAQELNKLTTKVLNLPVEITLLDIKKTGAAYNVEFQCKW